MKYLPLQPSRKLLTTSLRDEGAADLAIALYLALIEHPAQAFRVGEIMKSGAIPPRTPEATVAQIMRQAGCD